MKLTALAAFVLPAAVLAAEPPSTQPSPEPEAFVQAIEAAHGREVYYSHAAVAADVRIEFGGKLRHEGTMTFDTTVGRSRIETVTPEGEPKTIVFDGQAAWVSPPEAHAGGERFDALTWPYFLAAPFKLTDPGVNHAAAGELPLTGEPQPAVKMTFDPGTGDAPDDWYLLFKDPQTDLLAGMPYIVTYRPGREPKPHAIVYARPETIGGVTFYTEWTFHNWNEQEGVTGEPIGRATIRNIRFVDPPAETFQKPAEAKEDPLPAATKE